MKMVALASGRDFNYADRDEAPSVVIVNETAARQWHGAGPASGKTLQYDDGLPAADKARILTVIAIARDTKYRSSGTSSRGRLSTCRFSSRMRAAHDHRRAFDGTVMRLAVELAERCSRR